MSNLEMIFDAARKNIEQVPNTILDMTNLKMLYLQDNLLSEIPDDFFLKLPLLTWLDLRNNRLGSIPETIAYHQHLENLLLSNNRIAYLPNEVGVIPKLKVLQLGGNPLVYPSWDVVENGTGAVCSFLRSEYETHNSLAQNVIQEEDEEQEEEPPARICEEKVIVNIKEQKPKPTANKAKECVSSGSLMVKGLSSASAPSRKIVHRISKSATKVSLKSTYNETNPKACQKKGTQTTDSYILSEVKTNWFEKIKALLADQERILQQERNLKALSTWRTEKKMEPVRYVPKDEIPEAPYGTDPAYNLLMTRQDLSKEIDKMINRSAPLPKQENVEKLINDLASELRDMDVNYHGTQTPHTQIDVAGKQIQMIMDIHKKLLRLQETNALQ